MGVQRLPAVIRSILLVVVFLLPAHLALAQSMVNVGAYNFPPYVIQAESEYPEGLLIDLLALLNQLQKDFSFVLVPTSVTRRYQDLDSGRFDLMLFESADWGWLGKPHESIEMNITDSDVYVAKAIAGRDQHYFDSFTAKHLALYTGYHYGFAGFDADRDALREDYQAEFSYSHESNLLKVLFERADIAVVNQSFLASFIEQNPKSAAQFLVSNTKDQIYQHQALLSPDSSISSAQLSNLLHQLRDSGQLEALLQRYHLDMDN